LREKIKNNNLYNNILVDTLRDTHI